MNVKLIRAFIASPSGLEPERRAAYSVALQLDKDVARPLGGRLELIGWEETLSGMGRPQERINADMESCDLFIGAMWTRWGSDPGSSYSSGFEEEFELSRDRYNRTGRPLMTVFFKDIDPLQRKDPGEDLKKVLAFQEKLRTERTLLYDSFPTTEAFAEKVRSFLTQHIINLLRNDPREQGEKQSEPATIQAQIYSNAVQETGEPAVDETTEAKFLALAAKEILEENGLDPVRVARLRLIAATAGRPENDKNILGVHDANLLYTVRNEQAFSFMEKAGLLSAGIEGLESENVPIWAWLSDITSERPGIFTLLTVTGEDDRRIGALALLRLLGERPTSEYLPESVSAEQLWLQESEPPKLRLAALSYLRVFGEEKALPLIQSEIVRADKNTLASAIESMLAIKLRADRVGAARSVLSVSFETLDEALVDAALAAFDELSNEELAQGLDHRAPPVRAKAVATLSSRNALAFDTLERAKNDESAHVRLAALMALERMGQPPSLDEARKILVRSKRNAGLIFSLPSTDTVGEALFEAYLADRLQQMSVTNIEPLLGSNSYRDAAYLNLAARRSRDYAERLRIDLSNLFVDYANQHWSSETTADRISLLTLGDPADTKRRAIVRQALDVVARQRASNDLELVRQVLDSKFISLTRATIDFLRIVGDSSDIPRLGGSPRSFAPFTKAKKDNDEFEEAARAILWLQPDILEKLDTLDLPDHMLGKLVELASNAAFERLADPLILRLLLTQGANLRRAVAMKVPASLSRRRVRRLLDAYRADPEGRYYIVTHWLDLGLAYPRATARKVALAKLKR
jgi:hypothetical protein